MRGRDLSEVHSRADVPEYCFASGNAFPWTTRRLVAIDELISDLDNLTDDERGSLKEAVRDLATDSPRTELAVSRFKKLATKAGQVVGGSLYKMSVDIGSEVAKKAILGP